MTQIGIFTRRESRAVKFAGSGVSAWINSVMDSCRRTGLSGVLCSLSLLCVILDIQLDGKAGFTHKNKLLKASSNTRTHTFPACLLFLAVQSSPNCHEILAHPDHINLSRPSETCSIHSCSNMKIIQAVKAQCDRCSRCLRVVVIAKNSMRNYSKYRLCLGPPFLSQVATPALLPL